MARSKDGPVGSLSAPDAAAYRESLTFRLDRDIEGWREMGNAALAKRLTGMGIRTAKGLRHDAETVRDFRRTLARKAAVADQADAHEIEAMRAILFQAITDLGGVPSKERLQEIDEQIVQIGLTLCEDRFENKELLLRRGLGAAHRRLAEVPGEIGARYRILVSQ